MKLIKYIVATLITLGTLLAPIATQALTPPVHGPGSNVVYNGTVYFIDSSLQRRAYTSEGAFLSYGFNSWDQVIPATTTDMSLSEGSFVPPQNGKILCADRGTQKGTCYIISDGYKFGFVSAADFTQLGFSFSRALYGDISFLPEGANISSGTEAHKPGVLVNKLGTIYLMTAAGLAGIPSMDIFNSWGFSFSDVVAANAQDYSRAVIATIVARQAGELSPRLVITDPIPTKNPLQITSPNGGEYWAIGSSQKITWNINYFDPQVDIYLNERIECFTSPCPALGRAERSFVLAEKLTNSKTYTWTVGKDMNGNSIPEGSYLVVISGSNDKTYFDESDNVFTITSGDPSVQTRDATRLSNVRQLASALELYYNDFSKYPASLNDLVSTYLSQLPVAPTPADGICSSIQNSYSYSAVQSQQNYTLTFCLGGVTGSYYAGVHTLSAAGIQ